MDIKSKNKLMLIIWLVLFTFGLNGIFVGFTNASTYITRGYYQTNQFQHQFNEFIDYLSVFELNNLTKEELKNKIIVTGEEIEQHRTRYGSLSQQISNIKMQYKHKIEEAKAANNQEVVDFLTAERDKKIEDITMNFKSDKHVRAKIIKQKEQKIEDYYLKLNQQRSKFLTYKTAFKYYLVDTATGDTYTNVNIKNRGKIEDFLNGGDFAYIQSYPTSMGGYLSTEGSYQHFGYHEIVTPILSNSVKTFEGFIAVPKVMTEINSVSANAKDFEQRQVFYIIYTLLGIAALICSVYVYKRRPVTQMIPLKTWIPYYNRIPIDVRTFVFVIVGCITLVSLTMDDFFYLNRNINQLIEEVLFNIAVGSFFMGLTILQGFLLFEGLKNWTNIKSDIRNSLVYRMYNAMKEVFMNRRLGVQVFIILSIVFAFGLGAAVVAVEPEIFLLYGPAVILIGIPLFIVTLRRIGYFNRITENANQLARGHFESDLPVKGKSVLATLAKNINTLKHGVKTSKKEQAKSERLKTELITNVSHDLRTPLTSIITYTELLKNSNLKEAEREDYIQVIDRKSKRLKVLIDDLFEASKMASGNIDLVKEKVDLVQLLQQALAEYDEDVKNSNVQLRVTKPETSVYANVDGQKLWRVFDNLIANCIKYSLENTRVYITMKEMEDHVVVTFKNITKYELGENIDELFERFKRGDTSRHTEGSGLGLAIAKSIVDLHGGQMNIDIDGDLFKVTVLLYR